MASELDTVWEGGKVVTSMAVDDDASDRSSKRSTRASSTNPRTRAKKGQVKAMSGSFTCWATCPETWNLISGMNV